MFNQVMRVYYVHVNKLMYKNTQQIKYKHKTYWTWVTHESL